MHVLLLQFSAWVFHVTKEVAVWFNNQHVLFATKAFLVSIHTTQETIKFRIFCVGLSIYLCCLCFKSGFFTILPSGFMPQGVNCICSVSYLLQAWSKTENYKLAERTFKCSAWCAALPNGRATFVCMLACSASA